MNNIQDIIIKHYEGKKSSKPKIDEKEQERLHNASVLNLTTFNPGLGDATILTSLTKDTLKTKNIFSATRHWPALCKFNKALQKTRQFNQAIRTELLEFNDLGGGHLSQRLQRVLGLKVEEVPRPYLETNENTQINKIGLHFSTGPSAQELKRRGFQEPRQLLSESKKIIKKFIENSHYNFCEFGQAKTLDSDKVQDCTGLSIEESIIELSKCEYFIGLNSGFMNVAAGLGLKSIIVVNVPSPKDLYLPVINDYGASDTNWLYPQNVHLFQNGENELVPSLSEDNLKKAIQGEIYPFWSKKYLDLLFDFEKE